MINIALIGCGRVSEFHCKAIEKQKKLKLIACCDLDINKAKYLAKKYKAQSFSNYNEMLKICHKLILLQSLLHLECIINTLNL